MVEMHVVRRGQRRRPWPTLGHQGPVQVRRAYKFRAYPTRPQESGERRRVAGSDGGAVRTHTAARFARSVRKRRPDMRRPAAIFHDPGLKTTLYAPSELT